MGFLLVLPRAGKKGDEGRVACSAWSADFASQDPYGRNGNPTFRPSPRFDGRVALIILQVHFSPINFTLPSHRVTCDATEHLYHNWLSTLFGLGLGPSLFQLLRDWVLKTPTTNVMKTVQLQQCWS
jgi:hypothetical protein